MLIEGQDWATGPISHGGHGGMQDQEPAMRMKGRMWNVCSH